MSNQQGKQISLEGRLKNNYYFFFLKKKIDLFQKIFFPCSMSLSALWQWQPLKAWHRLATDGRQQHSSSCPWHLCIISTFKRCSLSHLFQLTSHILGYFWLHPALPHRFLCHRSATWSVEERDFTPLRPPRPRWISSKVLAAVLLVWVIRMTDRSPPPWQDNSHHLMTLDPTYPAQLSREELTFTAFD